MATEEQVEAVRQMIERFYKIGGVPLPPGLQINEGVAAVFGTMLEKASECSKALNFVPRPPLGVASLGWLASQASRAFIGALFPRLSFICVRSTIWKWQSKLQAASQNASYGRILARQAA
jgi:hypothetical protein